MIEPNHAILRAAGRRIRLTGATENPRTRRGFLYAFSRGKPPSALAMNLRPHPASGAADEQEVQAAFPPLWVQRVASCAARLARHPAAEER
jgi:hypothetical protein